MEGRDPEGEVAVFHLAETGGATFTSYDNIDKAPEERERGIVLQEIIYFFC